METLNETGEMVLILGRFELNRKGAGGQDALGQTHGVMCLCACNSHIFLTSLLNGCYISH